MSGSCLHGKKSKICLSPLTSLPCPLCSLFLKSCPISLGRGFLGEGELFFFLFLEAQAVHVGAGECAQKQSPSFTPVTV